MARGRAERFRDIQSFGIDEVAAAAGNAPDVLRMENLDTDIPPPPSAVTATRHAVGTREANSWLPFTGLAPLREAIAERLRQQTGRLRPAHGADADRTVLVAEELLDGGRPGAPHEVD